MSALDAASLAALRERVKSGMSPKRFAHTLGVEECAVQMARIYCPAQQEMLAAAALLHDCTKEYGPAAEQAVIAREQILLREDELASPQILHAITAPAEIRRLYPELADAELLSCVRWHTTGREGLTLCEAILYLADVIERGREYPACVALRNRFWNADPAQMPKEQALAHLADCVLASLCGVRDSLARKGAPVCRDTLAAIGDLTKRKTF